MTIYSDSLASIYAVRKGQLRDWSAPGHVFLARYVLSQRVRVLCAARPVLVMLRAVILARAGRVNLVHVRAHTGGTGFLARMNDRADAVANRVRCEWLGRSRELPLPLRGLALPPVCGEGAGGGGLQAGD